MMGRLLSISLIFLLSVQSGFSALITNLPGAPFVNFKQYSGYYTVGTNNNHNLHYWFIESQGNPSTDPVLLWLTGGPGCSGLSALLTEWGPFTANPDGATLSFNQYSWNKNANILTLESPAGVGYSYATDGNTNTGDDMTANDNWMALVAFFNEFPQYKNNDFYVTGESYGGKYVPVLVDTILKRQTQNKINIKGFAIGNGCVSDDEGTDSLIDFQYSHGMIDDTKWQKVRSQCCSSDIDDCPFHQYVNNDFCGNFVNAAFNQAWAAGIDPYNMYATCVKDAAFIPKRFLLEYKYKTGKDFDATDPLQLSSIPCMNETAVTTYLNRADVRKALGIPSLLPKWQICNDNINENFNRQYPDMSSRVINALNNGLKAMLYSGDIDMACNFLMGQRFSHKLGIPLSSGKKSFNVNGQIGGFHTKYGNLDFVSVRGAGHMVPTDKPDVAFHVIDSFLRNKPF